MKKNKKIKLIFKKNLVIGQTLETKDAYLPIDKKHTKKLKESRPVIVVSKINNTLGNEEYAVIPTSTENTPNTKKFNKYGIKYTRNNIEVVDNDNLPITQNHKFKVTENSTIIPKNIAIQLLDINLNHTKFSSENRKKYHEFKNRYKKKKR